MRRQLPTLLSGELVRRGDNLLCFGLPGRGKSHLVAALGREWIQQHQLKVLFTPTFKLVTQLVAAKLGGPDLAPTAGLLAVFAATTSPEPWAGLVAAFGARSSAPWAGFVAGFDSPASPDPGAGLVAAFAVASS